MVGRSSSTTCHLHFHCCHSCCVLLEMLPHRVRCPCRACPKREGRHRAPLRHARMRRDAMAGREGERGGVGSSGRRGGTAGPGTLSGARQCGATLGRDSRVKAASLREGRGGAYPLCLGCRHAVMSWGHVRWSGTDEGRRMRRTPRVKCSKKRRLAEKR